jgi:hypothetical protein
MLSSKKKAILEKIEKERDSLRRFYGRNYEAMSFCLKNGYTVYPAAQSKSTGMVRLFKQKGDVFKPLSYKLYNQKDSKEMIECVADIDREYERMFNLKNNNNANKKKKV